LANSVTYLLTIKDHQFNPAELKIPAGQKIKLTVHNLDSTPEEFESYELNREKIIPGGQSTSIYIGPLEAGRYPFFGEFHQDTAQGVIVTE
jgi:plastocyanin